MDESPAVFQDSRSEIDAEIKAVGAARMDYSETPRRVLFVLGSGEGAAAEMFSQLAALEHTTLDANLIAEMAAGTRCSLSITTPMQMVPDIVAQLVHANVAVYQVRLLDPVC